MTTATKISASGAPAKSKARRRKRVNLPHQTVLRFGEAERVAVEATRAAMASVRGREVTFSEATRLLITDKVGAAQIEAQAQAIASGAQPGPFELDPSFVEFLVKLQRGLGHCQGSLNSVAKNLAFANKGLGFALTQEQVESALADVHALRAWADSVEHRALFGDP